MSCALLCLCQLCLCLCRFFFLTGAILLHAFSAPAEGRQRAEKWTVLLPSSSQWTDSFSLEKCWNRAELPYLWVPRKKAGEGRGFVRGKECTSQKWSREEGKVLDLLVPSHTVAFTAGESLPHKDISLEAPWVYRNAFLVLVSWNFSWHNSLINGSLRSVRISVTKLSSRLHGRGCSYLF